MIAIKDFEMPKKCIWDCLLCNEEGGACQLSDVKTSGVKRPSDCPLVEAIQKDQYKARLKADMVAMLTELQLEIEEHEESIIGHYGKETKERDFPSHKIERNTGRKECIDLIQEKINELKAESEKK